MKLLGKHTKEVAERIIEAFKQPQRLPKALAPIFIHRKDDVPCRRWSWHNQLIVALSATVDARGIKQWNKAGRKVKKGSSAIWILAPCIKKVTKEGDGGEEEERQIVYGFRSVPVFAVEDTEGGALPKGDDRYDSWINELPLNEVARAWHINVGAFSHDGDNPLGYYRYASNGNQAVMLGVENLSTWTHELVHAADHRLTNLKGEKWHKEIVAELGGAILLQCLGMTHDADLGGAFSYIEQYAVDAKKDTVKACIEVLDRVCSCVKLILDTAESSTRDTEAVKMQATA
jgi:N-terminal domain of anti-restriction factor ArdC